MFSVCIGVLLILAGTPHDTAAQEVTVTPDPVANDYVLNLARAVGSEVPSDITDACSLTGVTCTETDGQHTITKVYRSGSKEGHFPDHSVSPFNTYNYGAMSIEEIGIVGEEDGGSDGNGLYDLPTVWNQFPSIKIIELSSFAIKGTLPVAWRNMTSLEELRISSNQFTGTLPVEWAELHKLRYLSLEDNLLSGTLPTEWKTMKSLKFLDLSVNYIEGTLPVEWAEHPTLETLYLNGNKLSGTLPVEWGNLQTLRILDLQTNQLTGTLPVEWSKLKNMVSVSLGDNQLSGTLPVEWSEMERVGELLLHNNQFTGTLPAEWANLKELYTVNVYSNQLTGSVPQEWLDSPTLNHIEVGANKLTGTLPETLPANVNWVTLDGNEFSGPVPSTYTTEVYPQLSVMSLRNNPGLEGCVPKSWTDPKNLLYDSYQELVEDNSPLVDCYVIRSNNARGPWGVVVGTSSYPVWIGWSLLLGAALLWV